MCEYYEVPSMATDAKADDVDDAALDDKLRCCLFVAHGARRRVQGAHKEPCQDERQEICWCRT